MTKHPSDLKLWQYSRNLLSENELKKIRMHIFDCPDCMCNLVSLVELNQLEELDGRDELPKLDDTEAESMLRILGISPKKASETATNPVPPTQDNDNVTGKSFGSITGLGIAGLTTAGASLGSFIASAGRYIPLGPTLAAGHPENFSENLENDARNVSDDASISVCGSHEADSATNMTEGEEMALKFSAAPKEFGGDPIANTEDVYQGYLDTCAIRSQEIILRDFGVGVTQEELIATATENGWYRQGYGTSIKDVGNLLDHYGIPVNQYEDANVFNIANELAQGRKVIVAVDAPELYGQTCPWHDLLESLGYKTPNHALVVSGIDTRDINSIKVTLTDPGTGDVAKTYSWEEFVNAWEDSNYFMVSTSVPAPKYLPEMQNFDYELGHLSQIGNLDYETFFETYSPYMGQSYQSSVYQEAVNRFSDEQGWTQSTDAFETARKAIDTLEVANDISLQNVIYTVEHDPFHESSSEIFNDLIHGDLDDEFRKSAVDDDKETFTDSTDHDASDLFS